MDVGPELLLALRELESPGPIGRGIARRDRQRRERLPGERRAQIRIEREQLEQDRRSGARRTDDEERRVDRLGADLGLPRPRVLQPQPRAQHPQHLAAGHHPPDQVQLRLRVDRGRAGAGRCPPIRATRPRRCPSRPVLARATARISSGSRPTMRGGSPTSSPNRFIRRTQSGCTSAFTISPPDAACGSGPTRGDARATRTRAWPTPFPSPPTSPRHRTTSSSSCAVPRITPRSTVTAP